MNRICYIKEIIPEAMPFEGRQQTREIHNDCVTVRINGGHKQVVFTLMRTYDKAKNRIFKRPPIGSLFCEEMYLI
ncbi:hypothetical protein ASG97_18625 [Bacillus sp. Soil745]|nr:hypothetical protein ASG97_18625 [Bacillus sp. Soil745]